MGVGVEEWRAQVGSWRGPSPPSGSSKEVTSQIWGQHNFLHLRDIWNLVRNKFVRAFLPLPRALGRVAVLLLMTLVVLASFSVVTAMATLCVDDLMVFGTHLFPAKATEASRY